MEKTTKVSKTVVREEHSFYCDDCGKHLGTSQEYEDGYYQTFGEFEQSFCLKHSNMWNGKSEWFELKKCLCDECKEKTLLRIKSALLDLGFAGK